MIYELIDVDELGDRIFRESSNEKEALKKAKKDYPKCDFKIIDSRASNRFCEDCE